MLTQTGLLLWKEQRTFSLKHVTPNSLRICSEESGSTTFNDEDEEHSRNCSTKQTKYTHVFTATRLRTETETQTEPWTWTETQTEPRTETQTWSACLSLCWFVSKVSRKNKVMFFRKKCKKLKNFKKHLQIKVWTRTRPTPRKRTFSGSNFSQN